MLIIGGVGIFSAVRNMNKIIEDSDENFGEIGNFDNQIIFDDATNDTNKEIEDVLNEKEPIEIVLNFVQPVSGKVAKEHSMGELVYSETMNDYRTHTGIDILATDASSVVSAENGKIVSVLDHPLWGTCIEIEHANGFVTCYRNLSDTLPEGIEVGSYVSAGGIIGSVGASALVEIGEQTHLHFEMSQNGVSVDPLEYITFS